MSRVVLHHGSFFFCLLRISVAQKGAYVSYTLTLGGCKEVRGPGQGWFESRLHRKLDAQSSPPHVVRPGLAQWAPVAGPGSFTRLGGHTPCPLLPMPFPTWPDPVPRRTQLSREASPEAPDWDAQARSLPCGLNEGLSSSSYQAVIVPGPSQSGMWDTLKD